MASIERVRNATIAARANRTKLLKGGAAGLTNSNWQSILSNKRDIGWSYIDFQTKISKFDISKLPDYDNAAEPYFAFILMSRPSLNVAEKLGTSIDGNAANNLSALQNHQMTAAFANDKYGKQMLLSLSDYCSNVWMPIVTTQAKTYSVNDVELKTVDKGNTYFGHVLKYGKHSEEHRVSGTITIDFRNDRYLSILKMVHLWMNYIYLVSKTDAVVPSWNSQTNAILDYAGSIYYLVTRRDMRELVYWEKLTGVFPVKSPLSIFNYNDGMISEDNISVEFSYGIRSYACDPAVLLDINILSEKTISAAQPKTVQGGFSHFRPMQGEEHFSSQQGATFENKNIYASKPFITVMKTDGTLKYFLHWL